MDAAVWDATLTDVEKGWAIGPFSLEEDQSMTDKPAVISRRFGVQLTICLPAKSTHAQV